MCPAGTKSDWDTVSKSYISWVHDCVIKPNLIPVCDFTRWRYVGGNFYFLSLHKTFCFCLRHDGLFVGVNVLEVYLWHGRSMTLTHTAGVSLFPSSLLAWPHRVKCDAAVTNNCGARCDGVTEYLDVYQYQCQCHVSQCHNPMSRSVTLCQFCDNRHTKTLHSYSYPLSPRARVITIKILTHFYGFSQKTIHQCCAVLGGTRVYLVDISEQHLTHQLQWDA